MRRNGSSHYLTADIVLCNQSKTKGRGGPLRMCQHSLHQGAENVKMHLSSFINRNFSKLSNVQIERSGEKEYHLQFGVCYDESSSETISQLID